MKTTVIVFFVFFFQIIVAQNKNYPFNKWDEKTIQDAATADSATFLSRKEKEMVFIINLVRNNPKLFAETYAQKYIDEQALNKSANVKSLLKELNIGKTVKYLIPDEDFQKVSVELAVSQEKSGKMGHEKFDQRISKLSVKFKNSFISENIYYGAFEPIDVVMNWLIDEGVKGEAHRMAVLDAKNRFIGISVKPHKKEKNVVVVNFANQTYWE